MLLVLPFLDFNRRPLDLLGIGKNDFMLIWKWLLLCNFTFYLYCILKQYCFLFHPIYHLFSLGVTYRIDSSMGTMLLMTNVDS